MLYCCSFYYCYKVPDENTLHVNYFIAFTLMSFAAFSFDLVCFMTVLSQFPGIAEHLIVSMAVYCIYFISFINGRMLTAAIDLNYRRLVVSLSYGSWNWLTCC